MRINWQNYSRETVCFSSCSRELWKVLAWFQHLSGSFFPSVTSDDSLDLRQTAAKAGKGALHCRGGTGSKLRLPGETTAVFWTDSVWDLWTEKVLKGNSLLVSDYEAVPLYSISFIDHFKVHTDSISCCALHVYGLKLPKWWWVS